MGLWGVDKDPIIPLVVPFAVDKHLDVRGRLLPLDLEVVPTYLRVSTSPPQPEEVPE
jgi:hypothetical protein